MSLTHVIISALIGSFWGMVTAVAMRIGLLPVSPALIVAVGAGTFAVCILMFSLCIIRHDCD